jgi:lysophospholipase L1-like esterase
VKKLTLPLLIAAIALLVWSRGGDERLITIEPNATILAFGDSITAGHGAKKGEDYPTRLAELLGVRVINAGISGETSSEGLARFEETLAHTLPDVAIICEGGNDILRRQDIAATKQNLASIIELARAANAQVLLLGVPTMEGFMISTADIYDELASEYDIPYEPDIITQIIKTPSLKSDQIHPNAKGYNEIAKAVAGYFDVRR